MSDVRDKFKSKVIKTATKPKADNLGDKIKEEIGTVWKHGFPFATDEDQAIKVARQAAKDAGIKGKEVSDPEIIATDDHVTASEFLVKLTFGNEPTV